MVKQLTMNPGQGYFLDLLLIVSFNSIWDNPISGFLNQLVYTLHEMDCILLIRGFICPGKISVF